MKIGETVWVIVGKGDRVSRDPDGYEIYEHDNKPNGGSVRACDSWSPEHAPHRVVTVTLQPAGDAELLRKAIEALDSVNIRHVLGAVEDSGIDDAVWAHAKIWMEERDAIIAAARREVE